MFVVYRMSFAYMFVSEQPQQMQPLPSSTRSKLRSTQILTTLSQIVSELVQNAVDAKASVIEIGVDPENWSCWVRDDGSGISREGLALMSEGYEVGRYGICVLIMCITYLIASPYSCFSDVQSA
jgi:nitrate/nitrite-specific signal transduction histidine kinase